MMPQDERNAWVLEKMKTALVVETQQVNFKIRGLSVCPKAWRMYYYVTEYRYYKSRRIALGELPFLPHGNSYRYYESPKTDTARDYIQRFIDRYCDIMPHISEIALPPKMERCDVWNEYIKHCEELLMLLPSTCAAFLTSSPYCARISRMSVATESITLVGATFA